jgi:hypothetical protein
MEHTVNGVRFDDARILITLPNYRRIHLNEPVELVFDPSPKDGVLRGQFTWSETRAHRVRQELGAADTVFDVDVVYRLPRVRPGAHRLVGCQAVGDIASSTPFTIRKVEQAP